MNYFLIRDDIVFFDKVDCICKKDNYVIIEFCSGYTAKYECKSSEVAAKAIEAMATQMALS